MAEERDEVLESLKERVTELEKQLEYYKDKISDTDESENEKRIKSAQDVVTSLEKLSSTIGGIFKGVNEWVGKAWGEADDAASKYSKTIGASARGMETLRKNTINFVTDNSIGARFNTSMKELIQLQQTYNTQIGRAVTMTNLQLENLAAMRAIMGDEQTIKFTANFEKFGLDANAAADMFTEMFNDSASKGIVLEQYSKNFLDNIELAQKYTFEDGVDGLKRMAEQATALKWDMQQTASFADKVNSVEGSIKASAKLSVLGGSFAQFSNPMGMLYESLNDMEGLQDRMVSMFGNLGRWDSHKQQMEISAFNRMRIRAASEAMGISYDKALTSINAQGRRNEVNRQLGNRGDLNDEVRELILNSAQIDRETGKAYVTINGEKRDIERVSNYDLKALQNINKTQAQDVKDIAEMLRGYTDTIQGREKQYQAITAQYQENTGIGKIVKGANEWLGKNNAVLKLILSAVMAIGVMNSASSLYSSGKGVGTSWGKFKKSPKTGDDKKVVKAKKDNGDNDFKNSRDPKAVAQTGGTPNTGSSVSNTTQGKVSRGAVLKNAIKSPMAGVAFGIAGGAAGQFAYSQSKGKENNGWNIAGDALSYMGSGAAMGAMFGPWGAAIGAGVGALYGLGKGTFESIEATEKEKALEKLRRNDIWLNGDYTSNELKSIAKGQVAIDHHGDLRQKMREQGDFDTYYKVGLDGVKMSSGGLILGPSHENGGVSVSRSNIEVEGGEFVVNKEATKKHLGELTAINQENIKPIKPMGEQLMVAPPSVKIEHTPISVSPMDLNINGTMKLDLGGQQTQIDARQLLNNPEFVRNLTNVLTKEINIRENKRFDKTTYWRQF